MDEKQDSRSWYTKIGGAIAILASSSFGYLAGNKVFKSPVAGAITSGVIGGITLTTLQELQQPQAKTKQIDKKINTVRPINYRTDHAECTKSEKEVSAQSMNL